MIFLLFLLYHLKTNLLIWHTNNMKQYFLPTGRGTRGGDANLIGENREITSVLGHNSHSISQNVEAKIELRISHIMQRLDTHESRLGFLETQSFKNQQMIEQVKVDSERLRQKNLIDLSRSKELICSLKQQIQRLKFKQTVEKMKFESNSLEKFRHHITTQFAVKCQKLQANLVKKISQSVQKFEQELSEKYSSIQLTNDLLHPKKIQQELEQQFFRQKIIDLRKESNDEETSDSSKKQSENKNPRDQQFEIEYQTNCEKDDIQKVVSSPIYYIDRQGFILDEQNQYLLDANDKPVKINQQRKKELENLGILYEEREIEISFDLEE